MAEVTSQLAQAYLDARKPFVTPYSVHRQPAAQALREARIRLAWKAAGGYEIDSDALKWSAWRVPDTGDVRLVIRPDDHSPPDDFDGSERDLQEARDRAERDGMCGVEAQFRKGETWEAVDSTWGFIGDDWRGSGYDTDLMRAALDALAEHNTRIARDLEASRPDLYGA